MHPVSLEIVTTMDRSFLDASLPDLIKKLSLDEKVTLLAGKDWWRYVLRVAFDRELTEPRTHDIPRLGIPRYVCTVWYCLKWHLSIA